YGDTSVAAGEAVAVVVAVGRATEAGQAMVGEQLRAAGVEGRLTDLTRRAIPVSLGAGAAVVAAGLVRGRPVPESLASGVSLAVAAVPEGLPLVATMAQLSSAGRLARQGALVRNHRAIEALGRVDVLCTDKTGTLTVGRLAVRAVSDLDVDADLDGAGPSHRRVLRAAVRATPAPEEGRRLAHPTDAAIVAAAAEAGVGEADGNGGWTRIDELPFEPAQGFHATIGRSGRRRVVSVKGAPEVVLPRCDRVAVPGRSGRSEALSPAVLATVDAHIERLARRGLRVLAVAEGAPPPGSPRQVEDEAVTGLTLLGLVAIADPVRREAASAVRGLQGAGVRVCMVTGDHPSTAEGIAAELGILNGHRVMGGAELATLDDAELDRSIEEVSVFARVTPADKVRIVQSLQRVGRVVAMTGDGANDAPAIRLADVGVAMGSRSTPAARQAADVIVTNDDIETIIAAIVEGRALWGSVRDALAILLGGNLGEIAFTLTGAVLSGSAPLNTRQLLLVNLLTDVAPALAIATRPPVRRRSEELLVEGPDRSLGRPLERAIVERAAITALGASISWLPARLTGGPRRASTVALASLVGTQLAQTVTSGGAHPVVLLAGLGSAAVLVGIVQTPVLSRLFGCVPLDPLAWMQVGAGVGTATAVSLVRPVAAGVVSRVGARVGRVGAGPEERVPAARLTPALAAPAADGSDRASA
ncbi:MAG TPA: HAD-IC family P-type ATPase, partial [Acidimicrobiales bacterium]